MTTLPGWLRAALYATAVMNIAVALVFFPGVPVARALFGFPDAGHAFYFATVALFIGLFGVAYLWYAVAGRADRFFIAWCGAGKLGFVILTAAMWAAGELPARAALGGLADLPFSVAFLAWALRTPAGVGAPAVTLTAGRTSRA
jgi:hypothetical protein